MQCIDHPRPRGSQRRSTALEPRVAMALVTVAGATSIRQGRLLSD